MKTRGTGVEGFGRHNRDLRLLLDDRYWRDMLG